MARTSNLGGDPVNLRHPKYFMPFASAATTEVWNTNSSAGDSHSGEATFWTDFATSGVAVDTNFSAGVAKQILSTSTEGEMLGVLGPTAGGSETTTFTLVWNGTTYTSPAISLASGERAGLIIGSAYYNSSTGVGSYDGATFGFPSGLNAAKTMLTGTVILPSFYSPFAWHTPKLRFVTLAVSITHSANVTGTANNERQSGVLYRNFLTWS
jgi:hypothetical protein